MDTMARSKGGPTPNQAQEELRRKLALRRELLRAAPPGPVWLPFCGEGELAEYLYTDREMWAADIDPSKVARFHEKFPDANVFVLDCDDWSELLDRMPPVAVADFDANTYPYDALRTFWNHPAARSLDGCVIFGTDLQRYSARTKGIYRHPDGTIARPGPGTADARDAHAYWWVRHVRPWLHKLADESNWRVDRTVQVALRDNLYWGAQLAHGARVTVGAIDVVPDYRVALLGGRPLLMTPEVKRNLIEMTRDGVPMATAAHQCGVSVNAVKKHMKNDPEFAEAMFEAEEEVIDLVEQSLLQRAISGDVIAAQVVLYNKRDRTWRDRRSSTLEVKYVPPNELDQQIAQLEDEVNRLKGIPARAASAEQVDDITDAEVVEDDDRLELPELEQGDDDGFEED